MILVLYNVLIVALSPLWVPWMVWRARKRKEQPDWKQRCGDLPLQAPAKGVRRVWIHAVSVGEVMAALPVLKEVRRLDPDLEIVLSTTTSSGQTAAKERALNLFDHLVYFPIDVPRFVMAALMRVRPKAVAIMETELWLNFLWTAKNFGSQTILINGRVSDRSFPRSMRLRPYYKALFKNLDQALAQTETDADRLGQLGCPSPAVVGNTKFDAAAEDTQPTRDWRAELGIPADAYLVVVGSTRSELEEELVAKALESLPDAWVVHAPRHIERAAQLALRYGPEAALRSQGKPSKRLVLDTYGELAGIYAAADVVVIGGGFDDLGGQNLIQPLAHGKPVVHGPHMQNFRDVAALAAEVGATKVARDAAELTAILLQLRDGPAERVQMGDRASALVQANLGAATKCAEAIAEAAKA